MSSSISSTVAAAAASPFVFVVGAAVIVVPAFVAVVLAAPVVVAPAPAIVATSFAAISPSATVLKKHLRDGCFFFLQGPTREAFEGEGPQAKSPPSSFFQRRSFVFWCFVRGFLLARCRHLLLRIPGVGRERGQGDHRGKVHHARTQKNNSLII